jgi:hypothetical protein
MVKIFYGKHYAVADEIESWIKSNKKIIKILSINNTSTTCFDAVFIFSTILYEEI